MHRFSERARRITAYLLIVVASSLGFWRVETAVHRSDDAIAHANAAIAAVKVEADQRAYESCLQSNASRAEIQSDFVTLVQVAVNLNPNRPPDETALNSFLSTFQAKLAAGLPQKNCEELFHRG